MADDSEDADFEDADADAAGSGDDNIRNAHDLLVKHSFGVVENARGELQAVLPANLVRAIDWSTLELVSQPSVSNKLRSRQIDLLYRVEINDHPVFLYTVFEAQRTVDKTMPLRMLIYMTRIWDDWLRKRKGDWPPPPIVPMVLHHGEGKWTRSTQFADLFDLDAETKEAVAPFSPHFQFLLDDLALVADEDLLSRQLSNVASIVLGALKHGTQPGFAQSFFTTWDAPVKALLTHTKGADEFRTILWYFHQVNTTLDTQELREIMEDKFGPEAAKSLKTVGQRMMHDARQQGIELGLEQGHEQGLEQGLEQGQVVLLLRQLKFRFGDLPAGVVASVRAADMPLLALWAERVLDAKSLDQVFEN